MSDIILSHNIQAEQSLLATLLIDNKYFDDCLFLDPLDFYKTKHQIIFSTMLSVFYKKQVVDLVTLCKALEKSGELETVGVSYITKLVDTAQLFNVKSYVEIIQEHALTRKVKLSCMSVAVSNETGEELLSKAHTEILNIKSTSREDNIRPISELIPEHINKIERANTHEEQKGFSLGFPNLDRCLKIKGGKLFIIAGRPGMGKTALSVTAARNLDKQGVKVGFLSIEMPEEEILDRLLAIEAGLDSAKFGKYKGLDFKGFQNLTDAAGMLYESSMIIDGTGSLDIIDVERKCRKLKQMGCQVIFIDQLSQIGNKYIKSGELTALYSENCTRIARLKKELNMPIFLLAQLNRDLKNRASKEPILSDLKQSGKIEEDADAVIFVHRPEEYEEGKNKADLKGIAVLIIAKNRSGPLYRDAGIKFVAETTQFYQDKYTPF